jgi:pimeloyl-ACP methyl ester carboxylesterase
MKIISLRVLVLALFLPMVSGGAALAASAIDERGYVPIGGTEQWITIKGADRDNPVVLFIHGGPGNALSPFADAMFAGWEKDFTLVQWDQRGAGRSYGRSGPSIEATLSYDRIVLDGIEVAEYLTTHLSRKKIAIVGGSWGSLVGVAVAKKRPDLFTAYVGTAQLVNMRENSAASYEHVLAHARATKDTTAVGELTALGPQPWVGYAKWRTFRKWRVAYQAKLATAARPDMRPSAEYASGKDLADSEAADDMNFAFFNFIGQSMTGPMMDIDLRALGRGFGIPMYFVHGAADLNAVPEVARAYFEWIEAPRKEFFLVPDTGHADSNASLTQVRAVLALINHR